MSKKNNNRRRGTQASRISNGSGKKVRKTPSPKKVDKKDVKNCVDQELQKIVVKPSPTWAQITKIDVEKEIQRNFEKEKIETEDEKLFRNLSKGIRELREKREERIFDEWYFHSTKQIDNVVDVVNIIVKGGINQEENNDIVWALYQSSPVNKKGKKLLTELDDHFEFRESIDCFYPHSKLNDYCKSKNYYFLSETLPNPDYGSMNSKMYGWYHKMDDLPIEIIEVDEEFDSESEDFY